MNQCVYSLWVQYMFHNHVTQILFICLWLLLLVLMFPLHYQNHPKGKWQWQLLTDDGWSQIKRAWLVIRGFLISGDIVIISAILLPFYTRSYQVICLPVTTIATHTFIKSIFHLMWKVKVSEINFVFHFIIHCQNKLRNLLSGQHLLS